MSKRVLQIVYALCCLSFLVLTVSAAQEKVILDIPGNKVLSGKNISVLGIVRDSINVDVDGVTENIKDNRSKMVNGVFIYVVGFSRSPPKAILDITVNIICGDKVCGAGEDQVVCCTDCGCLSSKFACSRNRCIENITSSQANNECNAAADCNDDNSCTIDTCDDANYPSKCVHTAIAVCKAGDACCPEACDTAEDADCKTVDKCQTNKDCEDNDACTTHTCSGSPKRCSVSKEVGCSLKEQCVVDGTIDSGKFCVASSGEWLAQKSDEVSCAEDFECLSLVCSWKKCGEQKSSLAPKLFLGVLIILVLVTLLYIFLAIKKQTTD